MNLDTYGGRIEKGRGILLLRNCFLSMWEKPGDMDLQGLASSHLSHASLSRSVNFDSDSVLLLHPQTHVHLRHIDRRTVHSSERRRHWQAYYWAQRFVSCFQRKGWGIC